ncbi:MAG: glycosyltransferase [Candidatus Dormibacteraeota bacterium]|nr:glycosyltransferase [Candidatus Dormibacteraeota bacterium]
MPDVTEVDIGAVNPERFSAVLTAEQMSLLREAVAEGRATLHGRTVWNVNSTAQGGGVAEMLSSMLPYARGAGVDTRWLVIGGDDGFFTITKRIHNRLHGAPGDGKRLGEDDRRHYEAALAPQAAWIAERVRPDDVVILHDPQTAGLVPLLTATGAGVIWRCHVGIDTPNDAARDTWSFLLPYVRPADICIFSRRGFAWDGLDDDRIRVVAPSIDPFSSKNFEMDVASIQAILEAAGIMDDGGREPATYTRADGSIAHVRHRAAMVEASRIGTETPLVVQVSRWDRLKDPLGVLEGFIGNVAGNGGAHLVLAGPSVAEVSDDPEGAAAYEEVALRWNSLDDALKARVHLACLPMDDDRENAAMVNALQRRAQVVVQKSVGEGFGLTVAEAMWKTRPVVASRVGGIQDQIDDGVSGILLDDPHDPVAFGEAVCGVLLDGARAAAMGRNAHARVQQHFLGSRHLAQYVQICGEVVGATGR